MFAVLNRRITSAAIAVVAAALMAGCSDSATSPTPPAAAVTSSSAATTPAEAVTSSTALASAARREIALRPPAKAAFPRAHGKAKFKSGSERELEIEIEDMRPRVRVVYFLGTQRLGASTVNTLGAARLVLRGAAAPASVAGKLVQVKTSAGVLVVRGQF